MGLCDFCEKAKASRLESEKCPSCIANDKKYAKEEAEDDRREKWWDAFTAALGNLEGTCNSALIERSSVLADAALEKYYRRWSDGEE